MPIRFRCHCGQELEVDDSLASTPGRCPECNGLLEVPAASAGAGVCPCVRCGEQIRSQAHRCRFCGADQDLIGPQPLVAPGSAARNLTRQPEAQQKATISLTLGILGFAVPCAAMVLSPLAIHFAQQARAISLESGFEPPSNTTAGIVTGWIGLGFAMLLAAGLLLTVFLSKRLVP